MKSATWNIISWSGRNHEILTELHNFKIDFCAISKTKKKGTMCIEDYMLAYSGQQRIREIKEGYWESFAADMEHDIYGAQKKVWKLIRQTKKEVNEFITNNKTTTCEWENFFRGPYRGTSCDLEPMSTIIEDIPLSKDETEKELRSLKNRKYPSPDGISNEMLKYGSTELTLHLTQLFQQILKLCTAPKAWKESIIIPLFKRGSKTNPDN
jgi:hypothetical protein